MNSRVIIFMGTVLVATPLQVMAEDDVTIRLMQQDENTEQAVLHRIELPGKFLEVADENALENGQQLNREKVQNRHRVQEGEPEHQQQQASEEQQEEWLNENQQERQEAFRLMEQRQEGMAVEIEAISPVSQEAMRP